MEHNHLQPLILFLRKWGAAKTKYTITHHMKYVAYCCATAHRRRLLISEGVLLSKDVQIARQTSCSWAINYTWLKIAQQEHIIIRICFFARTRCASWSRRQWVSAVRSGIGATLPTRWKIILIVVIIILFVTTPKCWSAWFLLLQVRRLKDTQLEALMLQHSEVFRVLQW